MSATINSRSAKTATSFVLALTALLSPLPCSAADLNGTAETYAVRAERLSGESRELWDKEPKNTELAWKYARACFDAAEFAASDSRRAAFASEGLEAARRALTLDPKLASAHYYLGMNLGQLARTKKFGALKLVAEMEEAFRTVTQLNPRFDFAGAYRCLGLLYRDAPGWPVSVGNRGKARESLLNAIELSPDYPDNWLSLIEAYLTWGEKQKAQKHYEAAKGHIDAARKRFTGSEWQSSWEDWDKRRQKIKAKLDNEIVQSPKSK